MYTGVYKDNVLVATGLILIKRLPLSFCMYYLPRGPMMDYKDNVLVHDYDSKSYNTNRYEYTDTYLKIFKSCKAIHHGYTMSIADTVQARFQSNVYSYENIEKTLPKHTKRLIKDS